jgi:hypothetical protein
MVEIQEENLNNIINNEEEEAEPIKRGRGRPKKINVIDEEEAEPIKKVRGRPKKINVIDEEPKPPKIRKKRIITAPWRYKEDGKYQTGGYKDRAYHMQYHRDYWRAHRVGWTCPYCNSEHVNNEHKKKHWATNRCRKIQEQKGILITETIINDSL